MASKHEIGMQFDDTPYPIKRYKVNSHYPSYQFGHTHKSNRSVAALPGRPCTESIT